ncbi:nicotinate-nucleotide--dimethylbenzimidazole phosphoribosyltransferase [Streptomyces sp. NEAU-H22]|uniref:nicotinate-nucleotide--dimethylbenzimidazole phosphoribosyltransferase n=1 Tax=Streptomyces sp. NEAU-H22 TaxID=2994655 RepID=UPI0022514DFB|nr:nicotinate-nucleotide--dimethylbenzimidazole phosphoribosyltransferase [Streptomyces sp. NEAU-H22]MCX3289349.1 nicotinate-nucleotide--dimethylbenzimidazole phosphoribosyltransferase [Streptomyces sp. NEAU-H22]
MTDTGQVPGEGLPESAGMVEQPGTSAPGAYTYLSDTTAETEDEDLLLPGAQGAWGNEVPPPAPEPVVETVHQPGPHEISGRDSGSVDLSGVRLPDPPPIPPITPRRPLHLGPPLPDSSASPVRSLADRGPADAPVRQPVPASAGPEYLDGPRASEVVASPPAAPWGAVVTTPAPVSAGAAPAETVVPAPEPTGTAQGGAPLVTAETSYTTPPQPVPAPAEAEQPAPSEQPTSEPPAPAEAGPTPEGDPAGEGVGPEGAQVAAPEQVMPAQVMPPQVGPAEPGVEAVAGQVAAAQAGPAAAGDTAQAGPAPVGDLAGPGEAQAVGAGAGYAVPEQAVAVTGDPVGAVAAPEAAAQSASVPEPVVNDPAQGGDPAATPQASTPDASAEQVPEVPAEQAVPSAPAPEAVQAPEAVPFPDAAAAPEHAAVVTEAPGAEAPVQVPGTAAQAPEAAAPETGVAPAPAPEAAAPEPDIATEETAPQPQPQPQPQPEPQPQPLAATDAAPVAQEPEATVPQPTTPGPEAPGQAAVTPAAEPVGAEAAAPSVEAEALPEPVAVPEAVATPAAPEPMAQAAVPADAPAEAPAPPEAPEAAAPAEAAPAGAPALPEAPEAAVLAEAAPAEAPAPAQAPEVLETPEVPQAPDAAQAPETAEAPGTPEAQAPEAVPATPDPAPADPAPAPGAVEPAAAPETPAPTEDVTVVLPTPATDEQPEQHMQGPQQSQPPAPETLEPPAPAVAVPAPRDGDAALAQNADDLDTRAAEQEDLADQERREESAAAVAEARQSSGPAAPGYDPAEREAVLKVMRERRDIRNGFRSDPIPHEVLLRVLEAAHHAPSVGHSQPWDFVVIRSADTRRAMHELAMRQRDAYAKSLPKGRAKQFKELKIEAILDTPVNIVVTADPTRGGRHTLGRHTQPQMAPYSAALAVENLWLAARAEGLGVGWVSFFDEREMVRALGLPEHLEIIAYLCVGYVDEFPDEPELLQAGWSKRRPLSWVVHEETYGRRALPGEEPHDLLAETVAQIRPLDAKALGEAWERQKRMTKPAGALGMLEIISAQLSGLSRQCPPPIPEPAAVAIFAGDHGVHAQGVTPWPQEVTAQMVANFLGGGAVCNAFATQVGAEVCIVDVGVAADLPATPGLLPRKIRGGTSDMTTGPAMTREEARQAIEVGIETARDLVAAGNKALLTGEMGIANTTASAALVSVFTGADPAEVTGRGTGINDETLARKTEVVRRALELHQPDPADPIGVLAAIGGFEHAAIVGLLLGGASLRTPVILDGVSAGAAALVARAIAPEVLAACIAGHRSAEPGHVAALNKLGLRPLVDLDLRLGEGTGALLALPLVQSTARAMHEVATFDSAGVTEK